MKFCKRIIGAFIATTMFCTVLAGCNQTQAPVANTESNKTQSQESFNVGLKELNLYLAGF